MIPLALLPWGKLAAAGAVVVVLAGTHWKAYVEGGKSQIAKQAIKDIAQAEVNTKATNENNRIGFTRFERTAQAVSEATTKQQAINLDASRARTELDSLRSALAAQRLQLPKEPAAACLVAANTSGELLAKCGAALADVSGKADKHANDALMLLQGWPK